MRKCHTTVNGNLAQSRGGPPRLCGSAALREDESVQAGTAQKVRASQ